MYFSSAEGEKPEAGAPEGYPRTALHVGSGKGWDFDAHLYESGVEHLGERPSSLVCSGGCGRPVNSVRSNRPDLKEPTGAIEGYGVQIDGGVGTGDGVSEHAPNTESTRLSVGRPVHWLTGL